MKDGGRVARVLRSEMWVSAEEARDQRCSLCRPLQRASRPCWGRSPRSAIATVSEVEGSEGRMLLTAAFSPPASAASTPDMASRWSPTSDEGELGEDSRSIVEQVDVEEGWEVVPLSGDVSRAFKARTLPPPPFHPHAFS